MFRFLRHYSTPRIAFVFDIDGVLLRGKKPIPRASQALQILNNHSVPYVLMTNGGGVTEEDRVLFLSKQLALPLSPLQIVQSHTPMKALAQQHSYNRVLVVGGDGDNARKCALQYGFRDVVTPIDLVKHNPAISPHYRYLEQDFAAYARAIDPTIPVDAVLVFNDPRDMGSDVQVVLDLLNSESGRIGTRRDITRVHHKEEPAIPIIFSNNDFVWANDYPLPRFGQGAFRITVESLYREANGLKNAPGLVLTIMGKPFKLQYDFTHHVLIDWVQKLRLGNILGKQILPPLGVAPESSPFDKIYMVGDNPESDIKGANDNGWESILLRTGVYRDADWDLIIAKPTVGVFDDVYDAISSIVKGK